MRQNSSPRLVLDLEKQGSKVSSLKWLRKRPKFRGIPRLVLEKAEEKGKIPRLVSSSKKFYQRSRPRPRPRQMTPREPLVGVVGLVGVVSGGWWVKGHKLNKLMKLKLNNTHPLTSLAAGKNNEIFIAGACVNLKVSLLCVSSLLCVCWVVEGLTAGNFFWFRQGGLGACGCHCHLELAQMRRGQARKSKPSFGAAMIHFFVSWGNWTMSVERYVLLRGLRTKTFGKQFVPPSYNKVALI